MTPQIRSLPVCILLLLLLAPHAAVAADPRPNILFILVDDLGWSDLACYGHLHHQTPHLDRLARDGMRFTHAYAPAPICSASRAAFLTGKTPARLQFEFVTKDQPGVQKLDQPLQAPPYPTNLPLAETTTAELLSPAGYRTAYFGKWHLNMHHGAYLAWSPTHGPLQQGFAEGRSDFGGHPYAYFKDGDRGDLPLQPGDYPADSLTDSVIEFLQTPRTQPFFVQWSTYYVHDPVHTRCRWLFERYRRRLPPDVPDIRVTYAVMVDILDHEIGRVLTALETAGLAENTLVVFTSDNGGHPVYTGNSPLRGSKWNLYEGGIRVPFIVRWPGRVPAGAECSQPVHGCDLLPTFCEAAGEPSPVVDGRSLMPLFRDPDPDHAIAPRPLIWHFPFYHPEKGFRSALPQIGVNDFATSQTRPHSAIRLGRYKLLHFFDDGRDELYDLAADAGESSNLAARRPELARELRQRLVDELATSGARLATPKP